MSEVTKKEADDTTKRQYGLITILLLFAVASVLVTVLLYVGMPWLTLTLEFHSQIAFGIITSIAFLIAIGAALVGVRREGYALLSREMCERMWLRWPKSWRHWLLVVGVFAVAAVIAIAIGTPLSKLLAGVPGFIPPGWVPDTINPLVVIDPENPFPGITLAGNWGFVAIYIGVLILNILGEELYFRGLLLPKMRGVFGRWDWVANGSLWALFHFFTRWNYPLLLPLTLGIAFIARKTRSVYAVMLIHFIINFIPVLGVLPLVMEAP